MGNARKGQAVPPGLPVEGLCQPEAAGVTRQIWPEHKPVQKAGAPGRAGGAGQAGQGGAGRGKVGRADEHAEGPLTTSCGPWIQSQ